MIIADIIEELSNVPADDLRRAIAGVRAVYRVFPVELKLDMLGDYSNTEYALLSALRSQGQREWGVLPAVEVRKETIFDIWQNSKE